MSFKVVNVEIELNIRLTYTFELLSKLEENSSCSHMFLILKSENWNYILVTI